MAIITQHEVRCPYCGLKQYKQMVSEQLEHSRLVYCDHEEGGCERMFAVQLVLLPRIQVYELIPTDNGKPIPEPEYDRRMDVPAEVAR